MNSNFIPILIALCLISTACASNSQILNRVQQRLAQLEQLVA